MSAEIKVSFSDEAPEGICIVAQESEDEAGDEGAVIFDTLAYSDSLAGDWLVDGIVRWVVKNQKTALILFNNKDEMEENLEKIQNAFGDLLGNDDE